MNIQTLRYPIFFVVVLAAFALLTLPQTTTPAAVAAPSGQNGSILSVSVEGESTTVAIANGEVDIQVNADYIILGIDEYRVDFLVDADWLDEPMSSCTEPELHAMDSYEENATFTIPEQPLGYAGVRELDILVAVRRLIPDDEPPGCAVDFDAPFGNNDEIETIQHEILYGVGEHISDGLIPESESFVDAYIRNGGYMGVGPQGSDQYEFVNDLGGYLAQGFAGGNGNPGSMIIHNHNFPNGCGAYQVKGEILTEYLEGTGSPSGWLGGPISDQEIAPAHFEDFAVTILVISKKDLLLIMALFLPDTPTIQKLPISMSM